MDLNRTHVTRRAAQSGGLSASLRRLAVRRAAPMLVAAAGLLAAGLSPAQAGTFNYTGGGAGTAAAPVTGFFSTGFDSPVSGSTYTDTLSFAGTTYSATDDLLAQINANILSFTNSGAISLLRTSGASNTISLGGTNPYVNFNNTGAINFGLDLSFASSGFLVKSSSPASAAANPVLTGGLDLGAAGNNVTVALADTGGDAQAELALTGTISGAGSLTMANNATVPAGVTMANQQDYGTLLVSGNNTYSGGTNINFGRLVVTNGGALGTGAINIAQAATSGGTLQLGNGNYTNGLIPTGITIANNINLAGAINGAYGNGIQNNQGNNTLSGVVTLTAAQANIAVGNGSLTVSNGIAQATGVTASLVKNGGATLFLTNNNTYTGSTTINGGYIQVGTGGTLAGGVVTAGSVLGATSSIINNGGTNGGLTLNYSNNISLDVSTITGTPSATTPGTFNNANGRITQAGPGTLTLTGTGTQGGYFVNTGTLAVGTGATLTGTNYSSIGVNGGDNGKLNVTGTGSLTQTGDFNIADNAGTTGSLTMSGSATVTANNLYIGKGNNSVGTVGVNGGTLTGAGGGGAIQVGTGGTGSAGTVNQTAGAVSTTTSELWIGNGNGSTGTYNISGGTLTSNSWLAIGRQGGSTGTLNISGTANVTKAGNGGNHLTVAGAGGIESGTITQTGGILTSTASDTWIGENGNGTYSLSGGTGNFGVLIIDEAGNAGSASAVNLSGTGTLNTTQITKTGGAGTGTLNFSGGTLVASAGAVATGSGAFLGGLDAANVQAGGAVINTNGQNVTVTQALVHNAPTGFPGADGGLTKQGGGTLLLTGANTYTGSTKVNAGTLEVGGTTATGRIGSGNVTVAANSALTLDAGFSQYIFSGATLFYADPATSLINLLYTGTDTISAGGSFLAPGVYGSLASGAPNLRTNFSGPGTLTVVAATPEPSQYAAFGLGLLGLGGLALRARRRSAA